MAPGLTRCGALGESRLMSRHCSRFGIGLGLILFQAAVHAEVKVLAEKRTEEPPFKFAGVPIPARNDAAAGAQFSLVDGERDRNSGEPTVLQDGRLPTSEDEPSGNFFFRAGSDGGRIQIDLGRVVKVRQVNTYSWHSNTRGPQVYRLYAADGNAAGFQSEPKRGSDPESCGWEFVAQVDTRPRAGDGDGGGQHGVSIFSSEGVIGPYRYLLLDLSRTEDRDAFGNTFYSEIDVIDAEGAAPLGIEVKPSEPILLLFEAEDGRYRFTLDASDAPDLVEWADQELRPVVQAWYPRIVALLPSDDFHAHASVTLRFRNDMGGTPASAGGGRVNMNSAWFRSELQREALGAVVHELVHVVQDYGRARRNPNATRTPGWLTEGIADYIRWFLYEPESRGAEITARNLARARYDASYRITGNFLDWAVRTCDPDLVRKLNAAAREGRYTEELWQECAGKPLQQLGEDWRRAHVERIDATAVAD
jgi:hypothetical protein